MAIIPAHIMRSVGGGYDNESLAVTAMCLTFFVWCRALRTPKSWWIGALAGLAYVYMVAAWGRPHLTLPWRVNHHTCRPSSLDLNSVSGLVSKLWYRSPFDQS